MWGQRQKIHSSADARDTREDEIFFETDSTTPAAPSTESTVHATTTDARTTDVTNLIVTSQSTTSPETQTTSKLSDDATQTDDSPVGPTTHPTTHDVSIQQVSVLVQELVTSTNTDGGQELTSASIQQTDEPEASSEQKGEDILHIAQLYMTIKLLIFCEM